MIKVIRRFQQPLMILITVLVIIAFAWLYNDTRYMDRLGADRVGAIYGRPVTQTQFLRGFRGYEVSRSLQMNDVIKTLGGLPDDVPEAMISFYRLPDEVAEEFVWNRMVLRHEAERLGITATQGERDEAIKQMRAFQNEQGVFDSTKLNLFIANGLAPRGLTADAFEDIVADQLKIRKIKSLLTTTAAPAPAEVRAAYEARNSKFECSVIRWSFADFLKDQQVSDKVVENAYEERKSTLLTEEQRKVKFAAFTLPNAEKPLAGKERVDLLSQLGGKAQEFAVAMTDKDAKLDEVAAKTGVTVEESPAFTAAAPPAQLGEAREVAQAAFKLTKEEPNSDPVQTSKGYYVLHLAEIVPARQKTFEEAKSQLAESVKTERAQEAMNLKVTEVRNKIEADLKAGKSLADAAAAAGVKAETFPPFSFGEPPTKERDAREVLTAASGLSEGQLSSFVPTGSSGGDATAGGLIVHLDKKQPIDEAKFEKEKQQVSEQVASGMGEAVFRQWFKLRRAEANVQGAQKRG